MDWSPVIRHWVAKNDGNLIVKRTKCVRFLCVMKKCFIGMCAVVFVGVVSCTPAHKYYQAQTEVPQTPWEGSSGKWGGYSDVKLSNGHEVTFHGYNEPEASACAYFVTVRAAELSILDGHNTFYSHGVTTNTEIEESNFPMRVIPGYTDRVPRIEYVRDRNGNARPVTVYQTIWVPEQRIPPHTAVNKIHTAKILTKYSGGGKKYDARSILIGAHKNQQKLGKVTIDPRVVEILKGQ